MAFPPNKNESAPVFEAGGGDSVMENNRRRTDTGEREIASGEVGVVSEMCSYSRSGRRMFPSKRLSDFGDLSKGFGNKEFKAEEGEGGRKSKRRKVERCEEVNLRDDSDLGVERCEGMNLRDDSDLGADQETRSNRKGKSGDGEKRSNRKGKSGDGEMGKVGSRDDQKNKEQSVEEVGVSREKGKVGSCCNSDDQKDRGKSVEEVGVSREKGKVGSCCNSDDQKDRGKSVEEVGVSREKGKVGSRCNSDDQKDRGKSVEEVGVSREKGKVGSRCNSDDQKDRGKSVEEVGVSREMCSFSRSGRRLLPSKKLLDYDGLIKKEEFEVEEGEGEGGRKCKRRKVEHRVGINLGDDDSADVGGLSRDQERSSNWDRSESKEVDDGELRRKLKKSEGSAATKREWTRLSIDGDAEKFIGFNCKVYWPADDSWYKGHIVGYNPETDRHHVKYCDGDEENLVLSKVKISFFVSPEEIQFLGLSSGIQCSDTDSINKEVVDLAATLGDSGPLVPGDILWAKVAGHPRWPAIVLDESACLGITGLDKISGEKTVLVQFFGTYEFARVRMNEITRFLKGLLRDLRSMCKKTDFYRSLEEAKTYICKTELPNVMLSVRKQNMDNCATVTGEGVNNNEGTRVEENRKKLEDLRSCPFKIGDLQIISLGKIVEDSDCFLDYNYICPEGYTALRNFPSISDPNKCISYKMEVLRDDNALNKPLFRVTSENGAQFEGPTSSSCWDKINRKIRKMQLSGSAALKASGGLKKVNRSGPEMFGFSHPEILKLIQLSSTPKEKLELPMMESKDLPLEYRSVLVTWKDIDKCNVCHMEEECENNLLLQCDKCRMMVHSRCYGEQEPVDGILWYCNLCRMGASEYPPPCCLCPVKGGAMKPTTDGRWAHLACAIWIPETCLIDYKKMEPVDGLNRIKKDRWKLLCSVCGVSYGACIQCSNSSCYVAYHPLCARVAGFCLEPEGEERRRLILREEDEYNQCIHLLSFCQRHKVPSNGRTVVGRTYQQLKYTPPPNPSGCARTEPYDYLGRKGIKEPEAHGSASLKRLYIENRPHLVGGCSQHDSSRKLLISQCDTPRNFSSMAEKYSHMSRTFKRRLAFGKSRIHGFGVFAKEPHLAGDMVIEYIGQVIRPPVADRREYLMYNSSVGAGTYMFRIDNERVIDATKAGSIAHLINHSCEPNCYSRIITVNGDEHIIIFAKRDIKQWEELTYDYRFFSDDEQLACYCGFPSCRGVVNYIGPHEPIVKQCVRISDLTVETRTSDCRLGSEQLENLNN